MRVRVHPRVTTKHPELTNEDVVRAFETTLRTRHRSLAPVQWLGVGFDTHGRLIEYVAVENEPDGWFIYHAMPATQKTLTELELTPGRQ